MDCIMDSFIETFEELLMTKFLSCMETFMAREMETIIGVLMITFTKTLFGVVYGANYRNSLLLVIWLR